MITAILTSLAMLTEPVTININMQVSDIANVQVTVQGKNDFPIARDDSYTTDEDTVLSVALPADGVLDNDTDRDRNDTIIVAEINGVAVTSGTVVTLPSGATLTINADGTFVYNPGDVFQYLADGETEVDAFTYKAANP